MPILDRFKDIYPSEYLRCFGWMRLWLALQMSIGMFMLSTNVFSADINIYVSPSGDDHRSGNLPVFSTKNQDGPVATLTRARDRVRELRKHGGGPRATIFLRAGRYFMNEPLVLGNEDSGSLGSPLLITSYKGERVILTGAVPVQKFSPYQGEILYADLDPAKFRGKRISQVFFDGQAQTLARYPNADPAHPVTGGWAYVDGAIVTSQVNRLSDSKRQFNMKPSDIRKWPSVEGGEIFIFARYNWNNDIAPIARYDGVSGLLILGSDITYDIRPGDRYFVQNLLSELDAPGEWYFDNKTSRLYFWPKQKIAANLAVMVSHLDTLFDVSNAQFVQIRGLDMEVTEGATIKLNNSSHCLIAGNTIKHAGLRGRGTYALTVTGGNGNQVIGNDISNIGGSGIMLTGGDVKTLTPSNHLADNNVIHHAGEIYKQGVGIELAGVGSAVRHNLIYDLPRMGILVAGNDHLIELNKIQYVNLETADSGAIYTSGRDWLNSRGVVIKHNEILDSMGFGYDLEQHKWRTHYFAFGVYLDDDSSGVDVVGNIIGRTSWSGVIVHGGTYNNIANNIIFDAGSPQVYFLGFGSNDPFRKLALPNQAEYSKISVWQKYRGFSCCSPDIVKSLSNNKFEKNIVVYSGKNSMYVAQRLLPVDGNKIDGNLIYHRDGDVMVDDGGAPNQQSWSRWQQLGFDAHSVLADPGLSIDSNGSIALSKPAVAAKIGFEMIPVDKIGPYQSRDRATWPLLPIEYIQDNLQ